MRLFTAIDLESEIKTYLYNLQFRSKFAKIRWIPKKNLHLTLKFFGDKDFEKIDKLLQQIRHSKFKLKLTKIEFFPSEENINIVWVGVEPEEKLMELQRIIDQETFDLGDKPVKLGGHITLGRVKSVRKKEDFLKELKKIKIDQLSFEVKNFKLFKSTLNKDSPKYDVLNSYNLE